MKIFLVQQRAVLETTRKLLYTYSRNADGFRWNEKKETRVVQYYVEARMNKQLLSYLFKY